MTTAGPAAAPSRTTDALRQRLFVVMLAALVIAAWGALWAFHASPYGRWLEHGGWGDAGAWVALCRAVPQGQVVLPALLHVAAWLLMIAAMMLPTTFPLLATFRRIVRGRADAGRLTTLVVVGFLAAWMAFGLVAHALDAALLEVGEHVGAVIAYGWAIGAAVLAGAGLFQFSALKYRCLEQCRTPFSFVVARWHGRSPAREALKVGFDHGVFCVGCCWALMLVMFVVGMGSLGWMLVLAAAMAAEKNLRWGRRLRTPVGLGLLAWSSAIVLANV